MEINKFWQIISYSDKTSKGDMVHQCELIRKELGVLTPKEIVEFQCHFDDCIENAYHWNIWGAAYLITCGDCDSDLFMHFRSKLISLGCNIFYSAILNPDSLLNVISKTKLNKSYDEIEDFLRIPSEVYEDKTGNFMPYFPKPPFMMKGKAWFDHNDDLKIIFPKLWNKFGKKIRNVN